MVISHIEPLMLFQSLSNGVLKHGKLNNHKVGTELIFLSAVDRFFVNWILSPGRDGVSPGHMSHVPALYYDSESNSVLAYAIQAMAFADVKNANSTEGVSFQTKARRSYGAALKGIRKAAENEQELSSDSSLATLLLVDSFEAIHLAHYEPLGPHSRAISFVLSARGDQQLHDPLRFALFRAANCRLQARQIFLKEAPEPVQEELLSKLNADLPEVRIAMDILEMSKLCSLAKELITTESAESPATRSGNVTGLLGRMQDLIINIDRWSSNITGLWKPKVIDIRPAARLGPEYYPSGHPLSKLTCLSTLAYSNVWFAYIWNFHSSAQIILRESYIELINYRANLQASKDTRDDKLMQRQREAITSLSSSITRSFPPLMGFTDGAGAPLSSLPQGLMAGRFLAIFALDVVARAEHTSTEHKCIASGVSKWIQMSHGLS